MIKRNAEKQTARAAPSHQPTEHEIREYAYHLYVQRGCTLGHEVEDWIEAHACLCDNISPDTARTNERHVRHSAATQNEK